jgi:hypothetical protein
MKKPRTAVNLQDQLIALKLESERSKLGDDEERP